LYDAVGKRIVDSVSCILSNIQITWSSQFRIFKWNHYFVSNLHGQFKFKSYFEGPKWNVNWAGLLWSNARFLCKEQVLYAVRQDCESKLKTADWQTSLSRAWLLYLIQPEFYWIQDIKPPDRIPKTGRTECQVHMMN